MYELEASVDFNKLGFLISQKDLYLSMQLTIFKHKNQVKNQGTLFMELRDIPYKIAGYKDFPRKLE